MGNCGLYKGLVYVLTSKWNLQMQTLLVGLCLDGSSLPCPSGHVGSTADLCPAVGQPIGDCQQIVLSCCTCCKYCRQESLTFQWKVLLTFRLPC